MKGHARKRIICITAAAAVLSGGCATQKNSMEEDAMMREENVQIEIDAGTLYGTIDLPASGTPCPVILIIPGSGPTDRDGNSSLMKKQNNSLKMTGAWFAANGIAALRYDKRGVGQSTVSTPPEETVFNDMITDAEKWIEYLKRDDRFTSMGILGHSEGSLVGMCAASRQPVDYFISVAGAGRKADVMLREQLSSQPGFVKNKAYPILDELSEGRRVNEVPKILMSLFKPEHQPYFISWNSYDPASIIETLEIPILIAQGSTDIQTNLKDAEILSSANPKAELAVIDGMNHILKDAPKGQLRNLRTYSNPKLPLSENFTETLSEFLHKYRFI